MLPVLHNTVKNVFSIVAEATVVVIKQEKAEEPRFVPESEKEPQSCFCPHGYSSATSGHYHCRHCGYSCRQATILLRHEKVHADFMASNQQEAGHFYSCRHCGFLSRWKKSIQKHERRMHAKSRRVTDKPVSELQSATIQVGTSILLETTEHVAGKRNKSVVHSLG